MEVLLATGILLACLTVLGQLAFVGRRHAESAERATTAQLICRTKLNEILVGAAPMTSIQGQLVTEMPGWMYSVEVQPLDHLDLTSLRATVWQDETDGQGKHPGRTFSLTRWMHDSPQDTEDIFESSSSFNPKPEAMAGAMYGRSIPMPAIASGFGLNEVGRK